MSDYVTFIVTSRPPNGDSSVRTFRFFDKADARLDQVSLIVAVCRGPAPWLVERFRSQACDGIAIPSELLTTAGIRNWTGPGVGTVNGLKVAQSNVQALGRLVGYISEELARGRSVEVCAVKL